MSRKQKDTIMNISPAAEQYHRTFFPNSELLRQDDPDMAQIIENFAFDEVPNEPGVKDRKSVV